ncbi:MAG: response regulator [Candidatus Obscuribacterales bacterium]
MPIRLMVVDDHPPTREAAVTALQADGIIEVIGEAETSDEAWKMASALLPDVVLLDLHLPGLMQTEVLIKKLASLRNAHVVVYASQSKAAEVQDLLDVGACAYILKADPPALARMAILMVTRGSTGVLSPSLPRNITKLDQAERNILKHVTKRGGVPKAAERMGLTEFDLNQILEALAEKLELPNGDYLVRWAKKHGF